MIERVAFFLNRNDEEPNIDLAKTLVETANRKGIKEIVGSLNHDNELVVNDCLKVLYEIGYRKPELIAGYATVIMRLLKSRNNRQVWGGMIALATIAALKPDEIFKEIDLVIEAYKKGSVITIDNAISVFAKVAAADPRYEKKLRPIIEEHLLSCRPKEVPQHAERAMVCVTKANAAIFLSILQKRLKDLAPSQKKRVLKLISTLNKAIKG
jgi:hypothetical protein